MSSTSYQSRITKQNLLGFLCDEIMNEYKLPNAKEARFRNKTYKTPIIYNAVQLTEKQKTVGY
ncbi:MAG: hypothetical protein ACOX1F_04120 [Erysipelotrichaceae bacterium]